GGDRHERCDPLGQRRTAPGCSRRRQADDHPPLQEGEVLV
ncbi:MAG: hypothetical protein AVDCRST_MAG76-2608, partial [uncultured Acidimicrobiales bacterium]